MPKPAVVTIHPSQFPGNVHSELVRSLRMRLLNHKFLYDGYKQTEKWLALHEAYSPARRDDDCLATYQKAFKEIAAQIKKGPVQVIGLGCGGGQKDVQFMKLIGSRELSYLPCDVSTPMVLTAREAALKVTQEIFPVVCDLARVDDLDFVIPPKGASRVITFFGMIPNFEPQQILPRLAALLRPKDVLLLSANLAPGEDYAQGLNRILPQYNNPLTNDWLMGFLLDLGVERADGVLKFQIDAGALGLGRVLARFHFSKNRSVRVGADIVKFDSGDSLRLFFSYRYTPEKLKAVLKKFGIKIEEQWIAQSGEEGVFLCRKA